MRRLRIVWFGTGGTFTLAPLAAVSEAHDLVAAVVPRRRAGSRPHVLRSCAAWARSALGGPSHLRQAAAARGIPVLELDPREQRAAAEAMRALEPDLLCVASFPCLLRSEVFSAAPLGCINLHPSLLPAYRGPSPWFWVYHNAEPSTGVTVHWVDAGEDSGAILAQEAFAVEHGMPGGRMVVEAASRGARLMRQTVDAIAAERAQARANPPESPTAPAARPRPGKDYVAWADWPIRRVYHFLRGVMPGWYVPPKLRALVRGGRFALVGCAERPHDEEPGSLARGWPAARVYGRDGWLELRHQPLWRRAARSVLAG